jgi:general secretion pathway protein M
MALSLPDGVRGRALALALTALVLAAAWLAAGQPLLDTYADGADALERRTALASRMAEVAASLPELKREAEAQSTDATPASAMLEGASDALAGAALQSLVEAMSASAGGHLTSTEALPAEQVGAYRRVALRVAVDAPWPVLARLIQAIERATPRMFVDDLQVRAQPAADTQKEPPLDISFTVIGFRQATSADAPTTAAPTGEVPNGDAPQGVAQ